jgi:hypothetical protein
VTLGVYYAYMWVALGVGMAILDIYKSSADTCPYREPRLYTTCALLTLAICVVFAPVVVLYRVWKSLK